MEADWRISAGAEFLNESEFFLREPIQESAVSYKRNKETMRFSKLLFPADFRFLLGLNTLINDTHSLISSWQLSYTWQREVDIYSKPLAEAILKERLGQEELRNNFSLIYRYHKGVLVLKPFFMFELTLVRNNRLDLFDEGFLNLEEYKIGLEIDITPENGYAKKASGQENLRESQKETMPLNIDNTKPQYKKNWMSSLALAYAYKRFPQSDVSVSSFINPFLYYDRKGKDALAFTSFPELNFNESYHNFSFHFINRYSKKTLSLSIMYELDLDVYFNRSYLLKPVEEFSKQEGADVFSKASQSNIHDKFQISLHKKFFEKKGAFYEDYYVLQLGFLYGLYLNFYDNRLLSTSKQIAANVASRLDAVAASPDAVFFHQRGKDDSLVHEFSFSPEVSFLEHVIFFLDYSYALVQYSRYFARKLQANSSEDLGFEVVKKSEKRLDSFHVLSLGFSIKGDRGIQVLKPYLAFVFASSNDELAKLRKEQYIIGLKASYKF